MLFHSSTGNLVDRIGRTQYLSGGLLLMGISVSCLLWVRDAHATAAALFGLGLGWNVSFVAATAELSERTEPSERGSLLGFNDLVSGATGAGLTLLGGLALAYAGVAALAIGGRGPRGHPRGVDPAPRAVRRSGSIRRLPHPPLIRSGSVPARRRSCSTGTERRSARKRPPTELLIHALGSLSPAVRPAR